MFVSSSRVTIQDFSKCRLLQDCCMWKGLMFIFTLIITFSWTGFTPIIISRSRNIFGHLHKKQVSVVSSLWASLSNKPLLLRFPNAACNHVELIHIHMTFNLNIDSVNFHWPHCTCRTVYTGRFPANASVHLIKLNWNHACVFSLYYPRTLVALDRL